jgi:hypothetical protein
MRYLRPRHWLLAALLPLRLAAGAPVDGIPDDAVLEARHAIVGHIQIERQDVFTAEQAQDRRSLLTPAGRGICRLLRAQPYLLAASITKVGYHDGRVDLKVSTKDVWTLYPAFGFGRGGGANGGGASIQDLNLLGGGASVGLSRNQDVDRSQTQFSVGDNNVLASRVSVSASYASDSDGATRLLDLERPFYALDTRWAGGGSLSDYTRTDSLYDQGRIIDQFEDHARYAQAYVGWSPGLRDGWVERVSIGITQDEHFFLRIRDGIGPALLSDERILHYPWLELDLLQDG